MRQILFRAKRLGESQWVQGHLFTVWDDAFILWGATNDTPNMKQVDPETVCEFTGLTDKNGVKIWEGSIIKYIPTNTILQVLYINGGFAVTYMPNAYSPINWEFEGEGENYDFAISNDYLTKSEVLGNIFDNPELLNQ